MIEFWTEVLPQGWWWTPYNYLGGTPELVINTAKSVRDDVVVYYDGIPGEYDGIYYLPRSLYKGTDVTVSFNSKPPKLGKYNILWCNWNGKKDSDYAEFDERIVQSPYQQSLFGMNSRIVPASCNKEEFANPKKIRKQCLYSSSPDRGGEFLTNIWDEVKTKTGANLIATYSKSVSDSEMIELYKSSEFWLHPGQGVEFFCISAVKAQVAKCIPVVVPNMALETTVKYGVKTTLERYKDDLINAILNPPKVEEVDFGSWQSVTDELLKNVRSNE